MKAFKELNDAFAIVKLFNVLMFRLRKLHHLIKTANHPRSYLRIFQLLY